LTSSAKAARFWNSPRLAAHCVTFVVLDAIREHAQTSAAATLDGFMLRAAVRHHPGRSVTSVIQRPSFSRSISIENFRSTPLPLPHPT
jgi:hypothetical protein